MLLLEKPDFIISVVQVRLRDYNMFGLMTKLPYFT